MILRTCTYLIFSENYLPQITYQSATKAINRSTRSKTYKIYFIKYLIENINFYSKFINFYSKFI